jgi:hypothetical protein
VVEEKPVEEDLVGILESAQIDMSLEVIVLSLVGLVRATYLLTEVFDMRWKKTVQAKRASLLLCERRSLIHLLASEEIHPAWNIGQTGPCC